MKELKFTQVEYAELDVLQNELDQYRQIQELGLCHWGIEDFMNALTAIDIAMRLWFKMRKKLESDSKYYNLTISISEAVTVLRCCLWKRTGRSAYEKHIAEKFKGLINDQLIDFIPTQQ